MEPHYLAGGTATTYSPVRTTSRSLLCFSSRSHKVTGPLTIGYTSDGLMVLRFGSAVSFSASFDRLADRMVEVSPDDPDGAVYWDQIMEYLEGHRKSFSLRLNLSLLATPFQRSVLAETLAIPFGHVRTYKEIAAAVDTPGASRAVGTAL